jgi:chromosome partitioning protein
MNASVATTLAAERAVPLNYERACPIQRLSADILASMSIDRGSLSRVVAIANGKGGVGKTSVATTLAGLAAAAGYRMLLIDLDPQGNVGEDLGYTGAGAGDDGAGLVAALASGTPLTVTLPQARAGVDVICGGEHLDDLAGILLTRHRRGTPVANVLAGPLADLLEQQDYDLVVIDCPPGEPNLQLLALGAARWLIIPTRGDAASLKGMSRIAQRLVEARTQNADLELLGVVLFDIAASATRVKREISNEINEALGGVAPLFTSTIRHSIAATDSRRRGLLIHEYAAQLEGEPFWQALRDGRRPSSPGSAPALAADYAALAHEILTRISTLETAPDVEEVMA